MSAKKIPNSTAKPAAKTPSKDTLYIDVEDEITAIIEKVTDSDKNIIAVVLPKRATVFQSAVNMKLLKKAASSAKKNIVLITTDTGIMSIAANAGLHVAKTPTSKPIIPPAKHTSKATETLELDDEGDAPVDESTAMTAIPTSDSDETIELDNTEESTPEQSEATVKKKKLMRVPDFSSFRLRVGIGVGVVIALIIFWVFGFVILPKATITVNTDIMTTSVNERVTFRVGDAELDTELNVLPAERVQIEKIDSVTVSATGEKNIGQKSTGIMTLTNCIKSGGTQIVPAGTAFSSAEITFVTTEAVTLSEAFYGPGGECRSDELPSSFGTYKDVGVVATQPGPQANLNARSYTSSISGINAFGSDMTGGTTQIVKVVSADDINQAEQQLSGTSKAAALNELQEQLSTAGLRAVDVTVGEGTAKVTATPAADVEAAETKVTMTITYSLLGVSDQDIASLLESTVKESLGDKQQNIRDNGLDSVKFLVVDRPNEAEQILTMETVATIGPEIDIESLKRDVIGKKRGEIERTIELIDGVRSVSVEYSPAWITTTPKSTEKIVIVLNEEK